MLPPHPNALARRAMLAVAAVAGLVLLHSTGTGDVEDFWLRFMSLAGENGLVYGYKTTSADYPPLAFSILWVVKLIATLLGARDFVALKVCLLLFYGVSVALFRLLWKEFAPLTLFVAVVLLSSVMLGYLDVLYTPTLLLALWALGQRRVVLFSALFAVSCLVKWQPIIIAPFVCWHALRPAAGGGDGTLAQRFARLAIPGGLVTVAVALTFGWPMYDAFDLAVANPSLSGEALNLNWIVTYCLHRWNPATYGRLFHGQALALTVDALRGWWWVPKALFFGIYAATLWRFSRGPNTFPAVMRAALLGYLAYCMFNTGVHENHLYVAAVLACVLAALDTRETARAIFVVAMADLNLIAFYGFNGAPPDHSRIVFIDATCWLSALYLGLFLWWWLPWLQGRPARETSVGTAGPAAAGNLPARTTMQVANRSHSQS